MEGFDFFKRNKNKLTGAAVAAAAIGGAAAGEMNNYHDTHTAEKPAPVVGMPAPETPLPTVQSSSDTPPEFTVTNDQIADTLNHSSNVLPSN